MGKVVLTTGVFDCGMHIGHFMLLLKCRELAGPDGIVIVGVNSDYSAEQYKRKPVFDQYERQQTVSHLSFIDFVIKINSENDILETIKIRNVDYYVKGTEWIKLPVTGEDDCQVIFIKPISGYHGDKMSTTEIIRRIRGDDVATPNKDSVLKAASKDKLI